MKLKCGIFLDRRIVEGDDWDMQPIGAHAYIRRKQRENAETASVEYYHIEDGRIYIVENPTLAEKALAQATRTTGKKVVGYRNESSVVRDTKELNEILAKESESQGSQKI